jgi:hypothetical protein
MVFMSHIIWLKPQKPDFCNSKNKFPLHLKVKYLGVQCERKTFQLMRLLTPGSFHGQYLLDALGFYNSYALNGKSI